MKIPLSLIKSFIHLDLQPAQIAETLTLLGLEVDGIEQEHPSFAGVVVGEILSIAPHSIHSERALRVQVSDGKETFQVVCGAPNCRPGLKTAFAKPGALLKDAGGKQRRIEKAMIRGIESFGMLCSEKELGVSSRDNEIVEFPAEIETGKDVVQVLWDPVFIISLTPNLGHCMSALGIARELSAALQIPIHRAVPSFTTEGKTSAVKVAHPDPLLSLRYTCRLIEKITIAPSPFWLQRQLIACGLEPICNAVDIANYILHKTGQPLHVFDLDLLEGPSLRVETSKAPQKFLGLDGIEREVPADAILILDAKQPVAIAGILGGANSAVSAKTTHLFIEAAVFDPTKIRQTAKKMGLRTESSQRFEKGVDPNGTLDALNEATALILALCGGRAVEALDWKAKSLTPKSILCRIERVNRLLGTRLSLTEIEEIFHRLGFGVQEKEPGILYIDVPLLRSDISEEIDLIEEIARIYGYNRIEKGTSRCSISHIPHDPTYLFEKEIREKLIGFGLQEFLNSDLVSKNLAKLAIEWIRPGASLLTAIHAKTEEYSVLRPSLLPGLLQTAQSNFNYKNHTLAAFEIGKIHFLQNDQLVEEPVAALILTGKDAPLHWSHKTTDTDFFRLKGHLEALFEATHLPAPSYSPSEHLSFHPGRQANIYCDGLLVGSFGEIHPSLLEATGTEQRILYAEINLRNLMQQPRAQIRMKSLPQFPSSERDWTISLPISARIETVLDAIHSVQTSLLEKVELIDLYTPEMSEKKNATFRFTYRDPFKTISFEEVESAHAKVINSASHFKSLAK